MFVRLTIPKLRSCRDRHHAGMALKRMLKGHAGMTGVNEGGPCGKPAGENQAGNGGMAGRDRMAGFGSLLPSSGVLCAPPLPRMAERPCRKAVTPEEIP